MSFDAEDPAEFLDLVQELRGTESSAYTESETPIFTCMSSSVERAPPRWTARPSSASPSEHEPRQRQPPRAQEGAIRDVTVIGAGPVGLSTAFWAGMREASARIVDSLPDLGGQLTTLYPRSGSTTCRVTRASSPATSSSSSRSRRSGSSTCPYGSRPRPTGSSTSPTPTTPSAGSPLVTDRGDLLSRTIVIAGGHGAFEPKKLPGYDMTPWRGAAPTTWWARSPSSPASG